MNCINCGTPNPEGSEYCSSCGAKISSESSTSLNSQGTPQVPRQLKPMGVGDVLDETIGLFRKNFRLFIGIVAVLEVPLLVIRMIQVAIAGPAVFSFANLTRPDQIQAGPVVFWLVSTLVIFLISVLATLIIEGALTAAISERYLGREITSGQAYRVVLSRFWRILGNAALILILLGLISLTIIGIPLAIYLGIRWMLSVQAIVFENKGPKQALSRSSSLIAGSWWRAVGILIVTAIAQYVVSGIPAAILMGIVMSVMGAAGLYSNANSLLLFNMITTVIGGVFGILAAPVTPTVITLLYYDLRMRKEGFDLQIMAQRMGQSQYPAVGGQP